MTCAERIRMIRMMEAMRKMESNGSDNIKTEDGVTRYYDNDGNVMIEASMKRRELD